MLKGAIKLERDKGMIVLDEHMNLNDPDVKKISTNVVTHIKYTSLVNLTEKLSLFPRSEGRPYDVYTRATMPRRYHFSKNERIGDVVLESKLGQKIYKDRTEEAKDPKKGDHGYDNRLEQMKAIFIAYGPSVQMNHIAKPFQNIELYNFFATLMKLEQRAPNNGTFGVLNSVLRQPPQILPTPTIQLPECQNVQILKCGKCDKTNDIEKNFADGFLASKQTAKRIQINAQWRCAWMVLCMGFNDYARYIVQGQLRVPSGFYNQVWKHVRELIRQYVRHYERLVMYAGPVYDTDSEGPGPFYELALNSQRVEKEFGADGSELGLLPTPTHLFVILLRCNGQWAEGGRHCASPESTNTLSFMLPLVDKDLNCLFATEYLFRHTVRIRDIELVTGLEWFADRSIYPSELAVQLRTYINEQLWQLEAIEVPRTRGSQNRPHWVHLPPL